MKVFRYSLLTGITIAIIAGILFFASSPPPQIQQIHMRQWHMIAVAEGNLGAGATGFMYAMIYPHQADPNTAYSTNLSNSSAYEYSDTLNAEMIGETPYDTAFDIVIKVRVNKTHAWNSTGNKWMLEWIYMHITCTDLGIPADTNMTEIEIANNSEYIWVHYYMNNAGNGYTITHNEKFNISSIKFYAYY